MRFEVQLSTGDFPFGETAATSPLDGLTWNTVTYLEPLLESHVSNGEFSELRFRAVGASNSSPKHPEDVIAAVPQWRGVRVRDTAHSNLVVFEGVVVKYHVHFGGTSEECQIIAYGSAEYLLYRINLHGQHRLSYTKEKSQFEIAKSGTAVSLNDADVVRIDTPLIFNPNGEPNMSQQTYSWNEDAAFGDNADNTFQIFDAPFRTQKNDNGDDIKSIPWTLSSAISYLLNCYPVYLVLDPDTYNNITSTLSIIAATDDPVISNVNLEGKNLLEALAILLTPYNFGFHITPGAIPMNIKFFSRTHPQSSGAVLLSARGSFASANESNLIDADFVIDGTSVVNNITAIGDREEIVTLCHTRPPGGTKALTLVPGWKKTHLKWAFTSADVVNPYDLKFRANYCNDTLNSKIDIDGGGSKIVYGVGRMWVINQGQVAQTTDFPLEDMTKGLATTADIGDPKTIPYTSMDPRRLEQPELYDHNSENALLNQTDIVVEMSTDGGQNWRIVERNWYKVLPAEVGIGIVFTDPQKIELLGYKIVNALVPSGKGYWQALYDHYYQGGGHNTTALEIRILATVKSDQRVKSLNPNDNTASPLAVERQFTNDGYRKVVFNSGISDAVYFTKYPPSKNDRDDTEQLRDLAQVQLDAFNRVMCGGQFSVLLDLFGTYTPGMQLTGITNRMDFEFPPIVLRVVYDFVNQHVHVIGDNRHHRTILKAPVTSGDSAQDQRLGIGTLSPIVGGHQGPLPVDHSISKFIKDGGAVE